MRRVLQEGHTPRTVQDYAIGKSFWSSYARELGSFLLGKAKILPNPDKLRSNQRQSFAGLEN